MDDWTNQHSGTNSKFEARNWTESKLHVHPTGVCVRVLQWIFLVIGFFCLGLYGFFKVEAYFHQQELESMLKLEHPKEHPHVTAELPKRKLQEGDLFGRIEIPRLNMS